MATFISLPSELQAEVTHYLDSTAKKNLRLTCSHLCGVATPGLFHTISIYLDEIAGEPHDMRVDSDDVCLCRLESMKQLASRPDLTKHVQHMRLHPDGVPPPTFVTAVLSQMNLLGVDSVSIHYRPTRRQLQTYSPIESMLIPLAETLPLRELTVIDTQNFSNPRKRLHTHESLQNMLASLRSLRLGVSIDAIFWRAYGYDVSHHVYLQDYALSLRSEWIEPACKNLTRLAIWMQRPWGYVPRLDLRGLHLPRLHMLELGTWMIAHDWQVDWVISHADTLKGQSDPDGYPGPVLVRRWDPNDDLSVLEERPQRYVYNRRWRDVFDRFAGELPLLRDFRFGNMEDMDSLVDSWEQEERQLPDNNGVRAEKVESYIDSLILPDDFEDGELKSKKIERYYDNGQLPDDFWIGSRLRRVERYYSFDGLCTHSPWRSELETLEENDPVIPQPKFVEEDKPSLLRLLRKINGSIPRKYLGLMD